MISKTDASPKPLTFLLTSSTASGHLLRVLDLAQQLSARGHRVLFKAKASLAAEVKRAGAELIPYERVLDFVDLAGPGANASLPVWMPKFPFDLARMGAIFESNGIQLAKELEAVIKRERVDCVVYDYFELGAAWAAERAGIPYASAGNMGTVLTRDSVPMLFTVTPPMKQLSRVPVLAHAVIEQMISLRGGRAKAGLPPYAGRTASLVQSMASPHLHIIMAHRGLAGDVPLRDNQLFVGPTAFNVATPGEKPSMHVEPGTVLISTTTTPNDDGLFRRVLEAVAPMNVPVLATSAGADNIPAGLGSHIRIERYVPHDEVFPKVQALITHGGWGTVGRALTTGLPMLVIPLFGDQPLNAMLVERAGLGRYLPLAKATPETIRAELQALLADEGLRARAKRVSAEIQQLKSEQVAARALEKLASGGKVNIKAVASAA